MISMIYLVAIGCGLVVGRSIDPIANSTEPRLIDLTSRNAIPDDTNVATMDEERVATVNASAHETTTTTDQTTKSESDIVRLPIPWIEDRNWTASEPVIDTVGAYVIQPRSRAVFCARPNACHRTLEEQEYKRMYAVGEFPASGPPDGSIASVGIGRLSFMDVVRRDEDGWAMDPINAGSYVRVRWIVEFPNITFEPPTFEFSIVPFVADYDQSLPITRSVLNFHDQRTYVRRYQPGRSTHVLLFRKTPPELFNRADAELDERARHRSLLAIFTPRYAPPSIPISVYQVIDYTIERSEPEPLTDYVLPPGYDGKAVEPVTLMDYPKTDDNSEMNMVLIAPMLTRDVAIIIIVAVVAIALLLICRRRYQ